MAAPSYTEDLTDIDLAESATGWVEFTGNSYNAQGIPAGGDPDYPYIQGSFAVTQDCTKDTSIGSLGYNAGTGLTIPTDGAFLVWSSFSSALNIANYANGGFRVVVGSSLADFRAWYVGGNDKGLYPYGGWQCHAANPTVTPDDTAGTPTTTYQYIGAAVNVTTGPKKGETHQVDALRYGRCSAIFTLGELADPATIAGFTALNDAQAARWGLIQKVEGGYKWQGRMQIGTTATAVYFSDSNKNVFIAFTPKVTYNFNTVEIQNASSYVSLTDITFQVLDITTASPGRFIMSDPADVYINQCTFIDMGEFVFDATTGVNTVEISGATFRRCGEITQSEAEFTLTSFINSDAATTILSSDLSNITNCSFTSDGSNHAIELDSNHAGGSYNLTGCTFTNYALVDGSTGNEAIYNNSEGAVTIYVIDGSIPSVRNGTNSTTTVIQAIDWYFEIVDAEGDLVTTAEFRIYDANDNELYGVETSTGTEKYTFSGTLSGTPARIVTLSLDYLYSTQTLNHPTSSNTAATPVVVALFTDRVYNNPT